MKILRNVGYLILYPIYVLLALFLHQLVGTLLGMLYSPDHWWIVTYFIYAFNLVVLMGIKFAAMMGAMMVTHIAGTHKFTLWSGIIWTVLLTLNYFIKMIMAGDPYLFADPESPYYHILIIGGFMAFGVAQREDYEYPY